MTSTTQTISWRELIVWNEGEEWDMLQNVLTSAPANLDDAEIGDNGEIVSWPQFFLAAPGEEPDGDTPRKPVNWSGFAYALFLARGGDPASYNQQTGEKKP